MNKVLFALLYILLVVNPLKVFAKTAHTIELRSAAFFHQSKKFQHIYHRVSTDFQIQSSFALSHDFELWGEIDYMTASNKKRAYYTKIKLINSSFGVQYIHSFLKNLDGYIGTGLSVERIKLNNRSYCFSEKECKLSYGSLSKLGIRYWFVDNLYLDVFVDYLHQKVHFKKSVNLSGFKTGVGIGIGF